MILQSVLSDLGAAAQNYVGGLGNFPAISRTREHSLESLTQIRAYFAANPPPPESKVSTLAVAGSLARLEASALSDLDLIVATESPIANGALGALTHWRDTSCETLNLEKPNPKGVFYAPSHISSIMKIAGESAEGYDLAAKRTLLILESKWTYDRPNYENLLEGVLASYIQDVKNDPRKNFVFLLNDVIKYFRSLCVNYQFTKSEIEYGKWPIRNIKLRHSRIVMYFSMVMAIGVLSSVDPEEKIEALNILVRMEPIQRLFSCYCISRDDGFDLFVKRYDLFLERLGEKDVRIELEGLDYDRRYDSPYFAELKRNSDELTTILYEFYCRRANDWGARFFEYMIL